MQKTSPLLGRIEAARFLGQHGFKIAPGTLMTLASRGGGPGFRKFGRRAVYAEGDLLRWARGRLSPITTTAAALHKPAALAA